MNARINAYIALHAGQPPSKVLSEGLGAPAFLPLFIVVDKYASALIKLANHQQRLVHDTIKDLPPSNSLPADVIRVVDELVQTLVLLNHSIEIFALQDTADPAQYAWRVRLDARRLLKAASSPVPDAAKRFYLVITSKRFLAEFTISVVASVVGYYFSGVGGAVAGFFGIASMFLLVRSLYLEPRTLARLISVTVFVALMLLGFWTWGWRPV